MLPKKYIKPTPYGFTITAKAYRDFIEENHLHNKIAHLLGTIDYADTKTIARASKHITAFISEGLMSKELVAEIFRAYSILSSVLHDATVTMQASSLPTSPFQGEATLLLQTKAMWSSLFSTESLMSKENIDSVEKGIDIVVQKGTHPSPPTISPIASTSLTATKVYGNFAKTELADDIAKRQVDGIYFYPQYPQNLAQQIAKIAGPFSPRPVLYQASGEEIETTELDAIKIVRNTLGLKNVWLVLPPVRTITELLEVKKLIAAENLYRSPSFKIWVRAEIPSNIVLLDKFIEAGIDGVVIDLQKLTMLMLGIDKTNTKAYDEQDPSVLWAVEKIIKTAHKHHISSFLFVQSAFTQPGLLEKFVTWGIANVSVNPEAIDITRQQIVEIEKKLIS